MSFEDDLAAQIAAEYDHVEVPIHINGNPYVIRVTQMAGLEWADEIDRHPARPDVALDRTFGYNLRTLTVSALVPAVGKDGEVVKPGFGRLLRDGEDQNLSPEQWDHLLRSIDGGTMARLGNAVFSVNEADRVEAIIAAGKALADESGGSSTSPANSGHHLDDSKGGSPSDA